MNKTKTTWRILTGVNTVGDYWLGVSIFIGLGLIVLDLFLQQGIYSAFAFPILYNAMDLIGYRNIVKEGIEQISKDYFFSHLSHEKRYIAHITQTYRILQHSWEVLLLLVIGLLAGWNWMIMGALLKFTSSADILYHLLGHYTIYPKNWYYQGWTIVGWSWSKRDKHGRKEIPGFIIYTQFVVGIAIVVSYYFLRA